MAKKPSGQASSSEHLWNDKELADAAKVYIAVLKKKLTGQRYDANETVRDAQKHILQKRTLRSVELRMQNISSVLYDIKLPFLSEWQPARNVGSGVKERIKLILYEIGIDKLEAYTQTAVREQLESRVSKLRKGDEAINPEGALEPKWEPKSVKVFFRDPKVKAWILEVSNGICEGCGCPAHFLGTDGLPYLEVHHVVPLALGGSDRITNTVALCSNCHMRCHYSIDRDEFKLHLYQKVKRLVVEVPDPNIDIDSRVAIVNS